MKTTKTKEGTYCGQRAEFYELLTAGKAGLRVHVHTWLEDGKQGVAGSGRVRVLKGATHHAKCLFVQDFEPGGKSNAVAAGIAQVS